MLPVTLAVACVIIAAAFAAFLPNPLAFRFLSNGAPRVSMNSYTFIILMVAAQIICALAAWGIATTIIRLGHSAFRMSAPHVSLAGYISLMTNMVLLPQIILAYIMGRCLYLRRLDAAHHLGRFILDTDHRSRQFNIDLHVHAPALAGRQRHER